jgi:hypothetical protein
MSDPVEISFDCLPLRSLGRLDAPLDAPDEQRALAERIRLAVAKHGTHNVYYLCNGVCRFHLTNDAELGAVEFSFEGCVLTNTDDVKTLRADLKVELQREVCPWLTTPAVAWLGESVLEAVRVEFDRYIAAGDLKKTVERLEKLQAMSDAWGGFLGMEI